MYGKKRNLNVNASSSDTQVNKKKRIILQKFPLPTKLQKLLLAEIMFPLSTLLPTKKMFLLLTK